MKKRIGVIVLLFTLSCLYAVAKDGYKIKGRINGLQDTIVFLGGFNQGGSLELCDTAEVDSKGRFIFSRTEPLKGGIYFVVHRKFRLFELLIDKEQNFSFETDVTAYTRHMKIKGSKENQEFYDYFAVNRNFSRRIDSLHKIENDKKAPADSVEMAKKALKSLEKEINEYRLTYLDKHNGSLLGSFLKALVSPELPEAPLKAGGKRDSLYIYYWYRRHYWDNIDLNDQRLLRTPVLKGKMDTYFNNYIAQNPDSVFVEAQRMIELVRPNQDMFRFFLNYLVNFGEVSPVMGMDKMFTEMVDAYYVNKQLPWIDPTVYENTLKRSNKLKPLLLGKTSHNLIMPDTSRNPVNLMSLKNKYIVVLFWSPECPHCWDEAPKMKQFYDENKAKYDLEIYAVCIDSTLRKMKDFINRFNWNWINVNAPRSFDPKFNDVWNISITPSVFLLDEKKMIIGKRLLHADLAKYLETYEKELKSGKPLVKPLKD